MLVMGLLPLRPPFLHLLCWFCSSPRPLSWAYPVLTPQFASLFMCPLVISPSVTSFNVIYIHADAQRSVSSPDLSSDLLIPKTNFLLKSYKSMPNNRGELNLPQI